MADNERKIITTFEANIDQFNSATQKLNSDIKGINLQFNNATATLDKYSDTQEYLSAKTTQLSKTLKVQQDALTDSKKKFNDLVASGKENSREAQNLASKILRQETAFKKTEKALNDFNGELDELKQNGVSSRKELDKLNQEAEDSKQAFSEAGNSIKNGFLVALAGIGTACFGAIKGLSSLVENTAELRLEQGRIKTAFEQAGFSSETAMKTYNEFNAILGDTSKATETLQQLANIAQTEEDLTTYTDILTGVYAKFGEALPVEGLMEAISHTSKLGDEIGVQGGLADALEWAGVSVEDFNAKLEKTNSEEERSALIQKELTRLYSETGEKYKETNKDVIEATKAQNDYNNKMAELGQKVQPAMTQFKTIMVEALTKVMDKFSEADIEGLMTNIANLISKLVTDVLPPLMNALSWILDNLDWLVPMITGLVVGIGSAVAVIKTYNAIVNLAKIAQLGWNAALMANPIGIVVGLIAGLVTAFVLLWNKCEGFRNFFINLWDGIKKAVKSGYDFIKGLFESIANVMKTPINAVIKMINGAIRGINKISVKVPDWIPEFGGKTLGFNIPTIPELAKGGVVDKPTLAMIGEAGKEAVVPLENNTAWIDKLAEKLNGKMQGNVTYNISNNFERMETTKLALHKSNLEMKKLIGG